MIETQLENIHAVLTEIRDLIKQPFDPKQIEALAKVFEAEPPAKKRDKKGTNETPAPGSEKQPDPATDTPTLDQLRDLGKRITEAGKFAEAKEWIRSKDATSLQTLSPDHYTAFSEFAKTLLA